MGVTAVKRFKINLFSYVTKPFVLNRFCIYYGLFVGWHIFKRLLVLECRSDLGTGYQTEEIKNTLEPHTNENQEETFQTWPLQKQKAYLEHILVGTEKQNLRKTQSTRKINITQQPIPSNLGFRQPYRSTGEIVILQTDVVRGSANGRGKKAYFILRMERQTHSPPPLPASFAGRGPGQLSVNSNNILSLQKPLEGIQSCTSMSWLSPFSWCKPGYVLKTWHGFLDFCLSFLILFAASLPATDQDPEGNVKWSNNTPQTPRANLRQQTLVTFSFMAVELFLTRAVHHSKAPSALKRDKTIYQLIDVQNSKNG